MQARGFSTGQGKLLRRGFGEFHSSPSHQSKVVAYLELIILWNLRGREVAPPLSQPLLKQLLIESQGQRGWDAKNALIGIFADFYRIIPPITLDRNLTG